MNRIEQIINVHRQDSEPLPDLTPSQAATLFFEILLAGAPILANDEPYIDCDLCPGREYCGDPTIPDICDYRIEAFLKEEV